MPTDPSSYTAPPEQNPFDDSMRDAAMARHPITIAFGIDNQFALPLAATLHSVLEGLSDRDQPHLYVMSEDLTPTNKDRLRRVVGDRAHLHWPALPEFPLDLALLTTSAYVSLASYYRIFLPALLPPACRRILYFDADVIVQGDVRALWETDMQGNIVMAVRDAGVFNFDSPFCIRQYQEFGIPPDAPYFNAGVLLIDLSQWRAEEMTQRFLTYSEQYGYYSLLRDQDTLNVILHGQWGQLDERWNIQANVVDSRKIPGPPERIAYVNGLRERLDTLTAGPHLIHFTERRKPWHPGCKNPFRSLFHNHLRKSKCFHSSVVYLAWYASRYLAWIYKKLKLTIRRIWKRTYTRSG